MSNQKHLDALYKQLEASYKELPLVESIEDLIHGEGPANAKIIFIGEAPGKQEVIERRPFVGKSGKLFRKTLIEEAGVAEDEIYISNIVKARPPENRDPSKAEIKAYKPYLDKEIEIIQPRLVITLGRFSMGKFLSDVKISDVHGRLHKITWAGKPLFMLPMYHPAAVRSNKVRTAFMTDFQKVPKILDWINKQKDIESLKSEVSQYLF